jgi:hypothetical protein
MNKNLDNDLSISDSEEDTGKHKFVYNHQLL